MNELETRRGTGWLGVLAGFAGGALVGTIATLLLAPRSGAETRRRILDRAERSKDSLARMATAAREGATAARTAFTSAIHEEEGARH